MSDQAYASLLHHLGFPQARVIGRGSSGSIFQANYQGYHVAVKCMALPLNIKPFLAEQRIQTLSHPNIIQLVNVEQSHGTGIIATELMNGDLMDVLERQRCIAVEQAKALFFQICSAISHSHSKHIAHLDLKPENIFLGPTLAKVGDWGSSVNFSPTVPQIGNVIGTFFYCSPEMLNSRPYFPDKCDIWSLGILLHTIVTGKWPYCGSTEEEIISNVRQGNTKIEMAFGNEFASLVHSMLNINPLHRPSADDILLHPWLSSVNPASKDAKKHRRSLTSPRKPKSPRRKSRQSGECRPMEVEYSTNDKSIPESLRLILSDNSPPPKRKKTSISNKAKSVCNGVRKILN